MAMSNSLVDVIDALILVLKNSMFFDSSNVWYGDEQLIPRTPSASVDPSPGISSELVETGMTVVNNFDIAIIVYHAKLGSQQTSRRDCDILAMGVRDLLHEDKKLGGLVFNSYVKSVEPGFSQRGQSVMMATQLTWNGRSKVRI